MRYFFIIFFLNCFLKIKSFSQKNYLLKKKVNEMIYKKYEKLCHFKARNFKQLHKYKCRDIKENELFICAVVGLLKSVKNYNGKVDLIYYAEKYILGELYSGMTKRQPINNKHKYNEDDINDEYQILFKSQNDEQLKNYIKNKKYTEYWEIIHNINNTVTQKIAKYKYDFFFNEIRSNNEISKLVFYSEETVRKHILIIKNELRKYILTNPELKSYI